MRIKKITIGSDVEYFLWDLVHGEYVSAEGIIKGTKEEPHRFDPKEPWFATSLDNVLAEGNIPPANSCTKFVGYMNKLRRYLDDTVASGEERLITRAVGAARLHPRFMETPNAQLLGCDPSYNAWTGEVAKAAPIEGDTLRSAGFHIHIGYEDPSCEANVALARAMDLFLGVPAVLLEPPTDRKAIGYGHAGNYRNQPHGVEYRTLSSYFAGSEELLKWTFFNTCLAVAYVNLYLSKLDGLSDYIQAAINTNSTRDAQDICAAFEVPMPGVSA